MALKIEELDINYITAIGGKSVNGLNPILPGGEGKICPPPVFLHHTKTVQGIKLKLSDFKDTLLRHILQIKSAMATKLQKVPGRI